MNTTINGQEMRWTEKINPGHDTEMEWVRKSNTLFGEFMICDNYDVWLNGQFVAQGHSEDDSFIIASVLLADLNKIRIIVAESECDPSVIAKAIKKLKDK